MDGQKDVVPEVRSQGKWWLRQTGLVLRMKEFPDCSGQACTSPLRIFAESVSLSVSTDCLQLLRTNSGFITAEPSGTTQTPTSELCTVSLGDVTSLTTRAK